MNGSKHPIGTPAAHINDVMTLPHVLAHDYKWRPVYCRYSVDMKVDGFDLIISGAQREDDSEIQCQLQGSDDLIKKVKVTVLGEYTKVIHCQYTGFCLL